MKTVGSQICIVNGRSTKHAIMRAPLSVAIRGVHNSDDELAVHVPEELPPLQRLASVSSSRRTPCVAATTCSTVMAGPSRGPSASGAAARPRSSWSWRSRSCCSAAPKPCGATAQAPPVPFKVLGRPQSKIVCCPRPRHPVDVRNFDRLSPRVKQGFTRSVWLSA